MEGRRWSRCGGADKKKTPTVWMDVFVLSLGFRLQGVDVELDGALEVRSLVLVHDVVLRELVEHRRNLRLPQEAPKRSESLLRFRAKSR